MLTLCIGAEVLVGDSQGPLLDVKRETSSPKAWFYAGPQLLTFLGLGRLSVAA